MIKMVMGRPPIYSEELATRVLAGIADGQSLRTVCAPDDMPNISTVFKWLHEREDFSERYARATAERTEAMIEDMHAIADDETLDPNSRRIRVDTRKWIASKLKPKKYGDKIELGGDTNAPLIISWGTPIKA